LTDFATIVLAAGAARRFGAPKQLAPVRGRPLLAHVLDLVDDPIVVLGAHAEQVRPVAAGARVVVCEQWAEGQAASLRCGVAAAGAVDAAVILLGDMPFLTRAVIAGARAAFERGGCDAVRTAYRGRPGHPVVLGRPVLDAVPSLRGDVGARELLARFRVREWEAGHLADPTDIDTPDQLEVT
jgi:CTP:molybdopterin cytidylyltransferase MocA